MEIETIYIGKEEIKIFQMTYSSMQKIPKYQPKTPETTKQLWQIFKMQGLYTKVIVFLYPRMNDWNFKFKMVPFI